MPLNFIAYTKEQLKVYSKNSVSDSGALFWDCTEKKGKKTEKEPPPPYKANRKIKQQKRGFTGAKGETSPEWQTSLPERFFFRRLTYQKRHQKEECYNSCERADSFFLQLSKWME